MTYGTKAPWLTYRIRTLLEKRYFGFIILLLIAAFRSILINVLCCFVSSYEQVNLRCILSFI